MCLAPEPGIFCPTRLKLSGQLLQKVFALQPVGNVHVLRRSRTMITVKARGRDSLNRPDTCSQGVGLLGARSSSSLRSLRIHEVHLDTAAALLPLPASEARGEGRGEGRKRNGSRRRVLSDVTASSPQPSPSKEERERGSSVDDSQDAPAFTRANNGWPGVGGE